jgi:dTDP-4-dehydrorhamnose reductase
MGQSGDLALITGAQGMLGRRVREALATGYRVVATARMAGDGISAALDVTDESAVHAAVRRLRPAVVVNCAGYTAVDRAEKEPELATKVNAWAPQVLAEAADEAKALMVHISSDFVFDGQKREPYVESDPTNPLSAYARSKEMGERLVRERARRHVIVRTQWLYGPEGKHFPGTILRMARDGRPLRVVDDQIGAPTYAPDVADAIRRILEAGLEGTIHVANRGRASWFQFARALLDRAGIRVPVHPITSAEFAAPAIRPPFSVLRNAVLEATIGDPMRPWEDALSAFANAGGLNPQSS